MTAVTEEFGVNGQLLFSQLLAVYRRRFSRQNLPISLYSKHWRTVVSASRRPITDKIKQELAEAEAARKEIMEKANAQANKLIEEARAAANQVKDPETQKAISQSRANHLEGS